jgi:predicted nuclease of predicted toxin-antitoxin system
MKILIDECLPKRLKKALSEHEAFTVQEMGWSSKKNGELLILMTSEFDVFLTVDQNLKYQQNMQNLSVAFIVLVALNNKLESLKPLMPKVLEVLETIQPREIVEIER